MTKDGAAVSIKEGLFAGTNASLKLLSQLRHSSVSFANTCASCTACHPLCQEEHSIRRVPKESIDHFTAFPNLAKESVYSSVCSPRGTDLGNQCAFAWSARLIGVYNHVI
jgi:hypothetical protein